MATGRTTQAEIAGVLGVSQQRISEWVTTNTGTGKGSQPDARVKLPKGAGVLGVDRTTVSRWVTTNMQTHKGFSRTPGTTLGPGRSQR